jgi:hypothetical protein
MPRKLPVQSISHSNLVSRKRAFLYWREHAILLSPETHFDDSAELGKTHRAIIAREIIKLRGLIYWR